MPSPGGAAFLVAYLQVLGQELVPPVLVHALLVGDVCFPPLHAVGEGCLHRHISCHYIL